MGVASPTTYLSWSSRQFAGRAAGLRAATSGGTAAPALVVMSTGHASGHKQQQLMPARMASTRSPHPQAARAIHSSTNRPSPSDPLTLPSPSVFSTGSVSHPADGARSPPLSVLPLTTVLRSLATTAISSSPFLLPPSLAIMSALANTSSPFLNPDKNPVLKFLLKGTFYAQFCAGENAREVRHTIDGLKRLGFSGVILGYAREVVLTESQSRNLSSCGEGAEADECIRTEIIPWTTGTMETVRLASPGDFVALKFTGAGRQALFNLSNRLPPSSALASSIDAICSLAASRGVRLLFDAEQQAVQAGIDDWALAYMRKYNSPGRATIYGTYQAYLKATPATLAGHLAAAREGNFTLGVKLVRGAYLGSDPRHLIHDTKAETDAAYDGIAAALLRRRWAAPLIDPDLAAGEGKSAAFPNVNMVLASHNMETVTKARAILSSGELGTEVAFAQLQGMADEVSCELLSGGGRRDGPAGGEKPRAYKYLVWGSTGECMKYLLRRAQENRDAVQRTRSGRDAMTAELWRRLRAVLGLSS